MNIQKLLEFPGILITIGVALLIISIIIIIIEMKSDKKQNDFMNIPEKEEDIEIEEAEEVEKPKEKAPKEEPIKQDESTETNDEDDIELL